MKKFSDPYLTAKAETRAWVDLTELKTLWFNTGTQCNLSCDNCYIESSPANDRLSYLSALDVKPYLEEIKDFNIPTELIALTGGEPFINPNIQDIIKEVLSEGLPLLILTNALNILKRHHDFLLKMTRDFPGQLFLRVSIDHYTQDVHEKERSNNTFIKTINEIKWLVENNMQVSIAGRSLVDESIDNALEGFQSLLKDNNIDIKLKLGDNIVIFPEMIRDETVPEITTACWDILNKKPEDQMCATERMIVKRKGEQSPVVLPCTLLAYDKQFELGKTLKESSTRVQLNHVYCAKFCVLGGASCSSAK